MIVEQFIYNGLNVEEIVDFKYSDKRFFIIFETMEFEREKDNARRIIKFYKIALDSESKYLETKYNYKFKTNIYINYLMLVKINDYQKQKYLKKGKAFLIFKTENKIKDSNKLIDYQKSRAEEYIIRDLNKLVLFIRENEEKLIKENEKYLNTKLIKYENLINALNELKPRTRNTFIYKLIESSEYELKEHKKMFLKWTLSHNKNEIKSAIIYILNTTSGIGLNYNILDYEEIDKKIKKKWATRFYYRDLYNRLYKDYLLIYKGNDIKAKERTMKDIKEKHTKPKK